MLVSGVVPMLLPAVWTRLKVTAAVVVICKNYWRISPYSQTKNKFRTIASIDTNLMYSALIAGALIGSSLFSLYLPVANAQSLMDQMSMMNGNETSTSQNMTMPQLNLGVVTMPVVCTSLGEVLGVLGSAVNMTLGGGGVGNETQEDIMDMMMQEIMPGGVSNMTEADIQELHNVTENVDPERIMNLQLCSLMTDEKMAEEMLMKK